MKLQMTTSLGLADSARLEVTAREGETVDVEGAAAEELIARQWAIVFVPPALDIKTAPRAPKSNGNAPVNP